MAFTQLPLTASYRLVGPDQTAVDLHEDIVRDLTDDLHLDRLIRSAPGWDQYVANQRIPEAQQLAFWRTKVRTPEPLNDDNVYVGWSDYWASVITYRSRPRSASEIEGVGEKNSRYNLLGTAEKFGFLPSADSVALAAGTAQAGVDTECVPLSSLAKNGITQQLGLLQDDILYNLSLLCKNVLEPVKAKYPGIVIVSGFRQVNTGIGQHERGQAADITIPSAPDTLIYEVADFIAKTLQFDQVILNYSVRRSPWIHVSFSSTGLRRTALTRDFDDTFHTGLFLITEKTGEDRAAALREQAEYLGKIDADLKILEKRQTALNPQTVIGDATAPGMGSADGDGVTSGGGASGTPDTENVPNGIDIVLGVFEGGHRDGTAWDLGGDVHGTYGGGAFTEAVVSALPKQFGHIAKNPTQHQHNGHAVDAIAYKSPAKADGTSELYNGKWFQVIDIVLAVGGRREGATAKPQWLSQGAPTGSTPTSNIHTNKSWYR